MLQRQGIHIKFTVCSNSILSCADIYIQELDNLYGMGRTRSTLHRKASVHKTKVAVEEMYVGHIIAMICYTVTMINVCMHT